MRASKTGFIRGLAADIFSRLNLRENLYVLKETLKDTSIFLAAKKILDSLSNFFWKRGFKKACKKIIEICNEEGVDARYHLVKCLPRKYQRSMAEGLGYAEEFEAVERASGKMNTDRLVEKYAA